MNKPALPGATGYAPVKGAVFTGRVCEDGIYREPENEAAWRAPRSPEDDRRISRLMFTNGNATPGGELDHDKTAERESGDDYDITPRQGQR